MDNFLSKLYCIQSKLSRQINPIDIDRPQLRYKQKGIATPTSMSALAPVTDRSVFTIAPKKWKHYVGNFHLNTLDKIQEITICCNGVMLERYYPQASTLYSIWTDYKGNLPFSHLPLTPDHPLVIDIIGTSDSDYVLTYDIFDTSGPTTETIFYQTQMISYQSNNHLSLHFIHPCMGLYIKYDESDDLVKLLDSITMIINQNEIDIPSSALLEFSNQFGYGIIPLSYQSKDPLDHMASFNFSHSDMVTLLFRPKKATNHVVDIRIYTVNVNVIEGSKNVWGLKWSS